MKDWLRSALARGLVIPAHPLALDADGRFDERRQRALTRYYVAAGAGGLAVGVHTTQFAIRDPRVGLFEPVLALAREEIDRADSARKDPGRNTLAILGVEAPGGQGATSEGYPAISERGATPPAGMPRQPEGPTYSCPGPKSLLVRIGGICGTTPQAVGEAGLLVDHGYHAGLLSLAALKQATDDELIVHCETVADRIPLIGFYLQPSVGGRPLGYAFWRRFAEIPQVLAIKIAPFNRYQTLDVVRAVADAGRDDIALYTGNDDQIVGDLVTPFRIHTGTQAVERRITGGLLGHWAVWTKKAVDLLADCHAAAARDEVPAALLRTGIEVTDANAAFFDAAHGFAGCIAGLHEVLRRQGLLVSTRCLDPHEMLSPGQVEEIDRVYRAYPHLNDDEFVAAHAEAWLEP